MLQTANWALLISLKSFGASQNEQASHAGGASGQGPPCESAVGQLSNVRVAASRTHHPGLVQSTSAPAANAELRAVPTSLEPRLQSGGGAAFPYPLVFGVRRN